MTRLFFFFATAANKTFSYNCQENYVHISVTSPKVELDLKGTLPILNGMKSMINKMEATVLEEEEFCNL